MNESDRDITATPALGKKQLREISRLTISDYNDRAQLFHEHTHDHDVSQNIESLLRNINSQPPWQLLDFGCGPGRDLKSFKKLGHHIIGLDGSSNFCDMARELSGCEVWQQDFLQLDLPDSYFDGIFANATLFHIPRQELPRVLKDLYHSMKPGAVLLSSNPHGNNEEGWQRQRYASLHKPQQWQEFMLAAGYTLLESYYRPASLPRAQQPWLATIWRK